MTNCFDGGLVVLLLASHASGEPADQGATKTSPSTSAKRPTKSRAAKKSGKASPDSAKPRGAKPATPEPTDHYDKQTILGWPVLVNRPFSEREPELCGQTLTLLGPHLCNIMRNVPAPAVEKLRQITIWVEEAEPHHPCMAYHPNAAWLREHDMNPDKAGCVELANARAFLDWTHAQPWMVFHELAHGYHDQFLPDGFENAELRGAHARAVESKNYESVLRVGSQRDKHYALTNPMELFAEASEAYFGTNDFYPFVRAELAEHDPALHALIGRLWE
jgi:hypothetical protein